MSELPGKWIGIPIKEVVLAKKGQKPKTIQNVKTKDSVPYILIEQMEGGLPTAFTSDNKLTLSTQEDVLIVWDGSIGKTATGIEGAVGSTIVALTPLEVESKYLEYFLASIKHVIQGTSRGTGLQHINPLIFWEVLFPLCCRNEQIKIVTKLDELFSEIDAGNEALKRVGANLKRYRASVLKAACEGKLVPIDAELAKNEGREYEHASILLERILKERKKKWENENPGKTYKEPKAPDTSELPELPEGWVWTNLDQLSVFITSGSRGWAEYYLDKGDYFIRAQNIKTDSLSFDEMARVLLPEKVEGTRSSVFKRDLLITITGANVTKTALVLDDFDKPAYINQHVALLRPNSLVDEKYLFNFVITPSHGRLQLTKSAYGAGKPGLSLENVRDVFVPLPPLLEQQRIATEIDRHLSVITKLEGSLQKKRNVSMLKNAILAKAFSGQLVPQDPNDEPASVLLERIKVERAKRELEEKAKKRNITRKPKAKKKAS